jgi:hypothetical protein
LRWIFSISAISSVSASSAIFSMQGTSRKPAARDELYLRSPEMM